MKKLLTSIILAMVLTIMPVFSYTELFAKTSVTYDSVEIYDNCMPAVVHITHSNGGGTGFFIESNKVVTNYHVIKEATEITMVDMDDKYYHVKYILGYDEDLDLAIIETKEKSSFVLKRNSHKLRCGEVVYTLGNPWGIPFVIAMGLLGKPNWVIDGKNTIMHTAPMSSGNSGGPLVNSYGEVIGVNTLSSVGENAQNLNYSVKIEELDKLNLSNPMDMETFVNRNSLPVNVVEVSKAKVGDYIKFGSYEQDNNNKNGKEDLEWLVLATEGDYLFVVSRFAIDVTCWNSDNNFVTYEDSEHKAWLNGDFYKNSFTKSEKKSIVSVNTSNTITSPKKNGTDKVFLMSMEEVDKYFTSLDRRASATEYCKALGAGDFGNSYTFWSTRTASTVEEGKYFTVAVFGDVTSDNPDGTSVVGRMTTRPAMWIKR